MKHLPQLAASPSRHSNQRLMSMAAALLIWLMPTISAAQIKLPDQASAKHLGVASCASSNCHGSVKALEKRRVLQNEYVLWSRQDPHANAMNTLRSPQAKKIAKNLGLDKPAQQSQVCMACHLENVATELQGEKFTFNDGIGCEACHGGAENWLNSHTQKNRPYADNIADGMYPTAHPDARAKLCLSCHLGNQDKLATHNIMGAGHPRLSFDLQTFSEIQPPHFRVDADYIQRKGEQNTTTQWVTGVYANAIGWLELLASDWLTSQGLFPELALFDCQACHHPMGDKKWRPREHKPSQPGSVRLADSNLAMVRVLTQTLMPAEQNKLAESIKNLHHASTRSTQQLQCSAKNAIQQLKQLQQQQTAKTLSTAQQQALLKNLLKAASRGLFDDYNAAEQAAFAVQLLLRDIQPAQADSLTAKLFATVANEDNYQASHFRAALAKINAQVN